MQTCAMALLRYQVMYGSYNAWYGSFGWAVVRGMRKIFLIKLMVLLFFYQKPQ